jgi:hypothetical protein
MERSNYNKNNNKNSNKNNIKKEEESKVKGYGNRKDYSRKADNEDK